VGDSAAAAGTTPSCTRTPLCRARLTPGEEGLVTPSQEMAVLGTVRALATEDTTIACTDGVEKAPPWAPEKIIERSSTCNEERVRVGV
jgi:hypothetical protein